jgi:stearoyl-CoA desaturase (delta-9 desaturase)
MLEGLLDLSLPGLIGYTLVMTHITIASVTIYLHRHQAHNALTLHPAVSHFFRAWLWLTTGMVTREWVAVHRRHHAKCETAEDPHSPQVSGILRVLFGGVGLYRRAAEDTHTLEHYGSGTPGDWLERRLYSRFPYLGLILMAVIDLLLLGAAGAAVFAVQILWIPLWAAGVINGLGHYWGYRNFETGDASRNLSPAGILIGGEELHNNHHAYPQSARLSNKWWEFDIGWLYIRLLSLLGLARVRRLAPRVRIERNRQSVDLDTLRAVLRDRYHVLSLYGRTVIRPVLRTERRSGDDSRRRLLRSVRKLVTREDITLDSRALAILQEALARSQALATVYRFRTQLKALWTHTAQDGIGRVERLRAWCAEAEASGIQALQDFAVVLRGYTLQTR